MEKVQILNIFSIPQNVFYPFKKKKINPHLRHFLFNLCKCLALSQTTTLDASKLKAVTDHNFKFIENGKKLSKQVENTVGKGEIARYEQFLLFLQCFQKTCTADT